MEERQIHINAAVREEIKEVEPVSIEDDMAYAEMREHTIEVLKTILRINDFEQDQEELIEYVENHILPLNNPYQRALFDQPEDLLRLIIVNYSPFNGRVMTDFSLFIRGVVSQLESNTDQVIPCVDLLCEIIQGAGLKYSTPNLNYKGVSMGKTVRKNADKLTSAEKKKLAQEQMQKQAEAKAEAIANAKQKAAEQKQAAKAEAEIKAKADEVKVQEAPEVEAKAKPEAKPVEPKAEEAIAPVEVIEASKEAKPTDFVKAVDEAVDKVVESSADSLEKIQTLNAMNDCFIGEMKSTLGKTQEMVDKVNEELKETKIKLSPIKVERKKMSLGKKLLIGGATIATLAAGGYLLSKLTGGSKVVESYDFNQ